MWEKMVCSECDSTEENTNVDNNNLTSTISAPVIQNKRKNYKKYIIIIILLFVTLWSGYAYLQTVWKISLNSAMEKIWWKDSIWLNENKIVNYLFGIDWNFEYKNVNWNSWSGVINIVDGKIYSANKWLNQKISVWELNSNTYLNNENQNISIKNLDIVSDNEKVYFFMEKWYDQLISLFWDLSSTWTITDIKNSFDWKKSIMIDNSKQLLSVFWELWNNELIKNLIKWSVTSNSDAYYKEKWVYEMLNKYLMSDKFIDYLFIEWIKDENTLKTSLSLNKNVCTDYAPVVLRVLSNLKEQIPYNLTNLTEIQTIEECNKQITKINQLLPIFLQIYKQWNKENEDYKLVIASWNILDIQIDYKNNIIEKWSLLWKTPDESSYLKITWISSKILSSNIKFNYEQELIKVTWDIIDWSWSILIKWKNDKINNINWNINFENYKLSKYDIDMSMKVSKNDIMMLVAKWTLESWNINIFSNTVWNFQKLSMVYDFLWKTYNLKYIEWYNEDYQNDWVLDFTWDNFDIKWINMMINSSYENKKFVLDWYQLDYDWSKKDEINIIYDNWKITWIAKDKNNFDLIISWDYINSKDFRLEIYDNLSKYNLNLSTKISWISTIEYILLAKQEEKEILNAVLKIVKSEESWYEVYVGSIDILIDDFYQDQIKNTWDSIRISDLMVLRSWIEQYYQDMWEYPTKENFDKVLWRYIQKIPSERSSNMTNNWCKFWYIYEVWDDKKWIKNQIYKLSTCLESESNIESKAKNDWWTDNLKFEIWIFNSWNFNEKYIIWGSNISDKKVVYNQEKSNEKISFNWNLKFKFKEWLVEYKIPVDYNEINLNLTENIILPNLLSTSKPKITKWKVLLWTTALAIWWTIWYISLQWYSSEARDSKRKSDINNIYTAINLKKIEWSPIEMLIIRKKEYEWKDVYVWWKKLVPWKDYFVWTPNYSVLWIKQKDFLDPNWGEYLIWYTSARGWIIVVFTFLENITSEAISNYTPNSSMILKKWKDYNILSEKSIKLNPIFVDKIFVSDLILWNEVLKISKDWTEITFNNKFDNNLIIIKKDTAWLIYINWTYY